MFEFVVFAIVFLLIFSLQKDISRLKREIYFLKNNKESLDNEVVSEKKTQPVAKSSTKPPLPTKEKPIPLVVPNVQKIEKIQPSTPKEHKPDVFDKLINLIGNYFTTGNIIVRIGGVVLFFGLAFLAKYAAEHTVISMEVRLFAIAIVAVVLIVLGWRFRNREGSYGIILQGIGVATLYLVVFSAAKIYLLMPLTIAFVLMLLVVFVGVVLSLKQNALPLALFSITGGFLSPILTSDGGGSHIILFGYYALLNLGIFIIAWYRSWRILNITGFFFTFVIATAWGVLRYESEYLLSCELFLILFYFFYLAMSILFSHKQNFSIHAPIDATLVFGLPVVAFSLQVSLLQHIEYALAWSAFVLGSIYMGLYFLLRSKEKLQLLAQSFFAIGIVFYTVMIPYIFGNHFTATLWALEGASMVYIALRQQQTLARYFGQILVLIATILYIFSSVGYTKESIAYLNLTYLGYIFLIIANLFCAYILDINNTKLGTYDKKNFKIFIFIGIALWLLSGISDANIIGNQFENIMILYIAIWGSIFAIMSLYFRWDTFKVLLQGYAIFGGVFLLEIVGNYGLNHPFEGIGGLALIAFFTVHYVLLYLFDKKWKIQPFLHLSGLWAIVIILTLESCYQASLLSSYESWWISSCIGVVSIFASVILYKQNFLPKFFEKYQDIYKSTGLNGLMMVLFFAILYSFSFDGSVEFGYIPLLNPVDILTSGGFFLFYKWIGMQEAKMYKSFMSFFVGMILLFSSVVLARSIHSFIGVEYDIVELLNNMVFQMALSILWSLIALSVIMGAKKLQNRVLWIVGASLMGIVVMKLFLVELSQSGSIERIVSFIVVGVLLLLIGYFAPLPPKNNENNA